MKRYETDLRKNEKMGTVTGKVLWVEVVGCKVAQVKVISFSLTAQGTH